MKRLWRIVATEERRVVFYVLAESREDAGDDAVELAPSALRDDLDFEYAEDVQEVAQPYDGELGAFLWTGGPDGEETTVANWNRGEVIPE